MDRVTERKMKTRLLGKTPDELKEIAAEAGLPAFAAGQMAQWMYVKKVRSLDEMTNISKEGRRRLSEKYEVGVTGYSGMQVSADGTKKPVLMAAPCGKGMIVCAAAIQTGQAPHEVVLQLENLVAFNRARHAPAEKPEK